MTAEENRSASQKRPLHLCPLLAIIGALIVYGITVDHWVTLTSLPLVARITGWDWHPIPLEWRQLQVAPLYLVLTSPIRVLPMAWQPLALNLFAALCGALTLGLLAASVRLLPQDRTREQRQRESGEFALLSVRAAFLPALFAVVMLGLQLTFWRNAMAANVDMLNVLVFAFLIFCLLKFRIGQNERWLWIFALVYGLGTTNDWALIGFFPFFTCALIWIMGVNFFNWRFLVRMMGFGVLGLLLYLLIPAMASLGRERANFWNVLYHLEWGAQHFGLREIPRWIVAVGALPTLMPLIFAGFKWPSFEGEISAAGNILTKLMFRLLHVVFLLLALAMFLDFKFSPSLRLQEEPIAFLTFYYMGALCIGYFSGYILLVYGKALTQSWERRSSLAKGFNLLMVGLLWALAVAAPAALIYQNYPHIRAHKNGALADYATEALRDLPSKPTLIVADDAVQIFLIEAAFARAGKPNPHIMLDSASLQHREYIGYLESRYPELKKSTTPANQLPRVLSPDKLIQYLLVLNVAYPIYYLAPSFGYYFEAFYIKPHGVVYELLPYHRDVLEPLVVTPAEVQENQAVWARLEKTAVAEIPSAVKLDTDAAMLAGSISVDLDYWAVALQKAGALKEANAKFSDALRINPDNFLVRVNKEYNEHLQKNDHRPINSGDQIFKAVTRYHGAIPILKYNGPVDEPDLDIEFGSLMADGHDYRQAIMLFDRRLQLLPGDVIAELDMAKTYVDWGYPDKALALVQKLHNNPTAPTWEVSRVEALAYYAKNDFSASERIMANSVKENPLDENRVSVLAEFYRASGYNSLREANQALSRTNQPAHDKAMTEASRRFNNSLTYLNQQLQLLTSATHQAGGHSTVPEILLKKAEMQMMLKEFEPAISTLNQIVAIQGDNVNALLNRAIAEVQVDQIQAAKDDFKALRKLLPHQTYVIDLGLADIAAREKDHGEEERRLKRYLETAPDDSPEYQRIKLRLKKLAGP